MDMNHYSVKIDLSTNNLNSMDFPKGILNGKSDGNDESQPLLHSREDGLSKMCEKPKRKVQWLDKNGEKLAEIWEFQPSDVSDSDAEDSDSWLSRIM